jgi:hypothetical protein
MPVSCSIREPGEKKTSPTLNTFDTSESLVSIDDLVSEVDDACTLQLLQPVDLVNSFLHSPPWVVTKKVETKPDGWQGEFVCTLIKSENPDEKVPYGPYELPSTHVIWFCPTDWGGTCVSPECFCPLISQNLPAILLCSSDHLSVYYFGYHKSTQESNHIESKLCSVVAGGLCVADEEFDIMEFEEDCSSFISND